MIKFICYPKCTTCQRAEKWLKERGIPYEMRDIKAANPTKEELWDWYKKSGLPLRRFFNTSGLLYKSLALKEKLPEMSEDEMLKLLASDGMLVKRPLLVADEFVLIGFKEKEWEENNKEKAAQLKDWFAGKLPNIDWDSIQQKPNDATRNASSACLTLLAKQVPNMIVSSADLCNSDKTDGFIKGGATVISRDNFGGGFLQAGVAELTMACCCIGMMLHGGVIAACGTFFVFSDYMKPAIRMAALMQIPIKFVWSHDAFRVGEDGPTHDPVEQEAQIRLMEKMKNHSGRNSMLVMRPADVKATTWCWKLAMENTQTPSALILSRQTIEDLPEGTDYEGTTRGAYIAAESDNEFDIIFVGNGSEVNTLIAGARLLRKDGYKVRVVSAPSEGLFREQPISYQQELFPIGSKVFGLTAGLPVNLQGFLVGAHQNSTIWGLGSFGYSAPYKVLDQKFGFTAENVYEQAKKILA